MFVDSITKTQLVAEDLSTRKQLSWNKPVVERKCDMLQDHQITTLTELAYLLLPTSIGQTDYSPFQPCPVVCAWQTMSSALQSVNARVQTGTIICTNYLSLV